VRYFKEDQPSHIIQQVYIMSQSLMREDQGLLHDNISKAVRNKYDRPGLLILLLPFSVESIKKDHRLIVYVRDGFTESGPRVVAV